MRLQRDGICHDAKNADHREEQANSGKSGEQGKSELRRSDKIAVQNVLKRSSVSKRDIPIHRRNLLLDIVQNRLGWHRGPYQQSAVQPREESVWNERFGFDRIFKAVVACVANDAD